MSIYTTLSTIRSIIDNKLPVAVQYPNTNTSVKINKKTDLTAEGNQTCSPQF